MNHSQRFLSIEETLSRTQAISRTLARHLSKQDFQSPYKLAKEFLFYFKAENGIEGGMPLFDYLMKSEYLKNILDQEQRASLIEATIKALTDFGYILELDRDGKALPSNITLKFIRKCDQTDERRVSLSPYKKDRLDRKQHRLDEKRKMLEEKIAMIGLEQEDLRQQARHIEENIRSEDRIKKQKLYETMEVEKAFNASNFRDRRMNPPAVNDSGLNNILKEQVRNLEIQKQKQEEELSIMRANNEKLLVMMKTLDSLMPQVSLLSEQISRMQVEKERLLETMLSIQSDNQAILSSIENYKR